MEPEKIVSNVGDLLALVGQQPAGVVGDPAPVEQAPATDTNNNQSPWDALAGLSDGLVKDTQSFEGFLAESRQTKESLAAMQQQLREYESKQSISPFSNPLVEKLNDVFKTGNKEEAKLYFDLAFQDLNTMDPLSVIKTEYRLKNPTLSNENIEVLIYNELGITDDMELSALPALQQAKLLQRKEEAAGFLAQKKVSMESAQVAPQVDPAIEATRTQIVSGWETKVLPAMPGEVSVSLPADVTSGMPDYSLAYKPSAAVVSAVDQQIVSIIKSNPEAFPLNEAGLANIRNLREKLIISTDFNNFIKTLVSDVQASAALMAAQKVAGGPPTPPGVVQPTPTRTPGQLSVKALDALVKKTNN